MVRMWFQAMRGIYTSKNKKKTRKPLMIALQLTFFKMALPDIKLSVYSLPHKYREEDLFLGLMKNHAVKHILSSPTMRRNSML